MENQDPNIKEGVLVVATRPQELKSTLTFQGHSYTIQRYHFNEYNATWTGYYRCSKCAAKLTVKIDELGEIAQNSSDNHTFVEKKRTRIKKMKLSMSISMKK